jgi:hypothetical protein
VDDILVRLNEATNHIDQRLSEERALLESIGEMLEAKDLEVEQQGDLIRLKTVVEECMVRHLALSVQINDTVEEFHKYQAYAFRSPRLSIRISPEKDLLPNVLDMLFGDAIAMAGEIGCHFLGPKPPKVLDLHELFDMYVEFHDRKGGGAGTEKPQVEEADVCARLGIDPQREERIRLMIVEMVTSGRARDIVSILDRIDEAECPPEADDVICAMHVLKTIFREEVPLGIEASIKGEFEHKYAVGTNLTLRTVEPAAIASERECT